MRVIIEGKNYEKGIITITVKDNHLYVDTENIQVNGCKYYENDRYVAHIDEGIIMYLDPNYLVRID